MIYYISVMSLLVLIVASLYIYIIIKRNKLSQKIKNDIRILEKKRDNMIRESIKKQKIIPGDLLETESKLQVIEVFFHEDNKFAVAIESMHGYYLDKPFILKISDTDEPILLTDSLTKELVEKSARPYNLFKRNNKNKFI